MANRRKFTSEFKKKVMLEAFKEREIRSGLAQKNDLHPQQITTWKAYFWLVRVNIPEQSRPVILD
jgi:transposase